ncbi:MAG: response regulator [SAR324 cluster bacterium]|uniref:Response regulator n=1 Tax=SAR324 cluster bacterium TaxID=2024889 RepID=A0A7X9FR16_9DELT|nr:response regulator [SAR324 cluster bacterium]
MSLFQRKRSVLSISSPLPYDETPVSSSQKIFEILGYLIEDAESFGQSQATLIFTPKQIQYCLRDKEGKKAVGFINECLKNTLQEFVNIAVHASSLKINLLETQEIRNLKIERTDNSTEFHLSWYEGNFIREIQLSQNSTFTSLGTKSEDLPTTSQAKVDKGKRVVRSKVVLIIEDNAAFANVLTRFLARQNIASRIVMTASEALDIIDNESKRPALIVCDVHMPGLTGLDFVRKVRAERKSSKIPVIMLSSDESPDIKIQAINNGADLFISKSEDPRILFAHVNRIISQNKRR